jgi:hypothetical protein
MTSQASGFPVPGQAPVTIIRPSRGWISPNLRDLWEYRELLYFLNRSRQPSLLCHGSQGTTRMLRQGKGV